MKRIFTNISLLAGARRENLNLVRGSEMKDLPVLRNAWLLVDGDRISDFGEMESLTVPEGAEVIDVKGRTVIPGWCDSHTHIVFAGSRAGEFEDRINGLTYAQIAEKGGGILNSARLLRKTSEQELLESALERLERCTRTGTVAIEVKSGYGLDLESELKMLRVIRQLKSVSPIPVKSTFLAAHAVPDEYKGNTDGYVDYVIKEILPAIAAEDLAEFIDVFCEQNYFSVKNMTDIMDAGARYGLRSKVHVNQFTNLGGVRAASERGALSVDHLELISDDDVDALMHGNTMPVALPGCSLFISIPYTPARKIIDAGLPLALATDFNPGSAPSGNMNLAVSLACMKMNMTPSEAIHAATINGAYAMGLNETHGSITPGKAASFLVTRRISSITELPYYFGDNQIEEVWSNGKRIH